MAIIHHGRILREGSVQELIAARREMELRVDDVARTMAIALERGLSAAEDDKVWVGDRRERDAAAARHARGGECRRQSRPAARAEPGADVPRSDGWRDRGLKC